MPVSPAQEAQHLLALHGRDQLQKSLDTISHQFSVIQTRTQLLLTLATLSLTITGFSGPKIAASNVVSRYCMVLGLVLVLVSTVIILLGTLRIRWITQFIETTPEATLVAIITYRNQKTRLFLIELAILVFGLTFYVASVVGYLMLGE